MIIIALAQMDVIWGHAQANRATARHMVAQAAAAGADLVLLPELWGSGYDLVNAPDYATSLEAGLFQEMATWAQDYGLFVAGSLLESAEDGVFNTQALFGPQGLVVSYRKIHLFRLMEEHRYLQPGERPALTDDLPWGATALATCYDLRFPELFRGYALDGARLILVPAQWPAPRADHWRTLLRARAIENQCFVAGCNRVGSDPNNQFGGGSALVGPWGEMLVEGDDHAALLLGQADPSRVAAARRQIPILKDRRPGYYTL